MLFLRSLPQQVREFVTIHGASDAYIDLKQSALRHESSQRLWMEIGGSTASQYLNQGVFDKKGEGKGKGKEKGKHRSDSTSPNKADDRSEKEKQSTCFRCGRKGHFQSNCRAKTDKEGKALAAAPDSKGSHQDPKGSKKGGKGKGKDGPPKKGKGKGKGKIAEFISEAEGQPESEMSPAAKAAATPPLNVPLTPFVASSTMPSSCYRTMLEFERETSLSCDQSNDCFEDWGFENSKEHASEQTRTCLDPDNLVSLPTSNFCDVHQDQSQEAICLNDINLDRQVLMPLFMPVSRPSDTKTSDNLWWLIDSGASASVVSSRFLSDYRVIEERTLEPFSDGFSSASGETIHPSKLVCIATSFHMISLVDPKVSCWKVCRILAFVADVPNNVLSVGSLLSRGWKLSNNGSEMVVSFDDFRLDVVTWMNVPWILHYKDGDREDSHHQASGSSTACDLPKTSWSNRPSAGKHVSFAETASDSKAKKHPLLMASKRKAEVDLGDSEAADPSRSEEAEVVFMPRHQPISSQAAEPAAVEPNRFVRVSEAAEQHTGSSSSVGPSQYEPNPFRSSQELVPSPNPESQEPSRAVPSGLPNADPSSSQPKSVEVVSAEAGTEHPSVLKKKNRDKLSLDEHRRQGHFPFHPDCLACVSAKSTHQHRRRGNKNSSEICADFFFLKNVPPNSKEQWKFLIMVDVHTGMKACVPVLPNVINTRTWIKSWMNEFGFSGGESRYALEVLTDAEASVASLFKGVDLGRDIVFFKASPQSHQTVGHAEGAIRILKDSFAALRQDLRSFGVDLKLDSRSCLNTVLAYICMCYNLHSSFKDTKRSPKTILIGRDVEMQTSLFGSLVLAEIPHSLVNKAVSRFEKSCYLRPEFASLGHLCVTVLNGEECIFISKSIKFLTPLSWDCSLAPSFLVEISLPPKPSRENGGEAQPIDLEADPSRDAQPSQAKSRSISTGAERRFEPSIVHKSTEFDQIKNVPASFINKFGKTKGCGICANSKGSFHGKVHHKVCIDRYVKWLKEQELKGIRDLPSAQVQPVGRTSDAEHPVRLTGKQPRPDSLPEPLIPVATRFGPPSRSKDHEMLVEGGEGGHNQETKSNEDSTKPDFVIRKDEDLLGMEEYTPSWLDGSSSPRDDFHIPEVPDLWWTSKCWKLKVILWICQP